MPTQGNSGFVASVCRQQAGLRLRHRAPVPFGLIAFDADDGDCALRSTWLIDLSGKLISRLLMCCHSVVSGLIGIYLETPFICWLTRVPAP